MGGIPHDQYKPKKGFETWLDSRLPIGRLVYDTLMIPTPKNLNWMWIWGIVLTFCLVLQIITGIIFKKSSIFSEFFRDFDKKTVILLIFQRFVTKNCFFTVSQGFKT